MKILQLCKKFPFPLKDGESIAITHLSKALTEHNCQMTLLAMNTSKHFFDTNHLPDCFDHYDAIHTVNIDNAVKPVAAFKNLFSKASYHIQRFISDDFNVKLIAILQAEQFDVIQLETLYLAPYIETIRKYSTASIAMRSHNVEHEIWERVSKHTSFFPKRWYLQHLTKKLKRYELEKMNQVDLLVPITSKDLRTYRNFGFQKEAVVTPIGLDTRTYAPNNSSYKKEISLSFIGSLDWMPNLEGIKWFLDNIWDDLSRAYPKLKLHVAGRNTPKWLLNLKRPNVVIHGEVNNAHEFINEHSVMIVPLHAGSGMRAKILEGMALGKVVISTSMGLEGIDAKHEKEVLVADTAAEFVKCIDFCYKSNGSLGKIGKNALSLAQTKYDNSQTAKELIERYHSMVKKPQVVLVK